MNESTQMRGGKRPRPVATRPQRVWGCVLALLLVAAPAIAQPGKKAQPGPGGSKPPPSGDVEPANGGANAPKGKPKVFDFTGLDISGRLRTPQLLYFLDRATEELERASLERRSYIPEMVRSVDEGPL